jgi:apolipoprotein N-acyltransferase
VKKKMMCGFGLFLFGMLWMYFATGSDVASYIAGFVSTITVMGLLLILYGLVKKFSI